MSTHPKPSQEYVRGLSPSHRGVCAGTVLGVSKNTVRVRLRPELSSGERSRR